MIVQQQGTEFIEAHHLRSGRGPKPDRQRTIDEKAGGTRGRSGVGIALGSARGAVQKRCSPGCTPGLVVPRWSASNRACQPSGTVPWRTSLLEREAVVVRWRRCAREAGLLSCLVDVSKDIAAIVRHGCEIAALDRVPVVQIAAIALGHTEAAIAPVP